MSGAASGGGLVSIVLPTHNGVRFLRQSVESCLAQTHRNLELIVVDDASTDGTAGVLAGLADARVTVVRNERNLGLPASLNAGFARARGGWLTWTSDDNWYEPEAIGAMLRFLTGRGGDFVRCDYFVVEDEAGAADGSGGGKGDGRPRLERLPDEADLAAANSVGPCFLYSRTVREAVGEYDPEALLAEDYDYWIRAAKRFSLERLPEPHYHYRRHSGSLTARSLRGCRIQAAAALVRIKNGLSVPEDEAGRLAMEVSRSRYEESPLAVRAVGRLLRTVSAGRLELAASFGRSKLAAAFRPVLERYAAGGCRFAEAAAALYAAVSGEGEGAVGGS